MMQIATALEQFLLTPLREGRHSPGREFGMDDTTISTHAPARGATTMPTICSKKVFFISTHAPARGATPFSRIINVPPLFLLTPLREGRRKLQASYSRAGANFYSRPCERGDSLRIPPRLSISYFYSRPCERGDKGAEPERDGGCRFLLTPLREGRLSSAAAVFTSSNFYSRPCERGDWPPARTPST